MGFFNVLGHMFDFRVDRWLDLKRLDKNTNFLIDVTRSLATSPKRSESQETFEEASKRLEWTPELLQVQILEFTRYILLFKIFTLLLLSYGFYSFWFGTFFNSVIIFLLAIFSATMIFRYHFWRYQLLKQKLGCTLKEWLYHCLGKDLSK